MSSKREINSDIHYLEKILEDFKNDERSTFFGDFTIDSQCKQYNLTITIPNKLK